MPGPQKMHLPEVVKETFNKINNSLLRRMYIKALTEKGWTMDSIAEVLGISKQRVHQLEKKTTYWLGASIFPIPSPPKKEKPELIKRPQKQIRPESLKKLLKLHSIIKHSKVKHKKERIEFVELIDYINAIEGVSFERIGKKIGLSRGALINRLYRYGQRKTNGKSKCVLPLKNL